MKSFTQTKGFKRILSIVLCAVMILGMTQTGAIGNVQAVEVESKFTVTVKDKYTDAAIEGANITIVASDESATYVGTTNEEGVAEIADITSYFENGGGAFDATYKVTANGYVDVEMTEAVNIADKSGTIVVEMIDNVAPSVPSVTGNATEWTKENIVLTVVPVEENVVKYRVNGGEWQDTAEFTITANGTYQFTVKDNVGLVSDVKEILVEKIDKDAPVISSVVIDPKTWTKETVILSVCAEDNGSGVKEYKMDDGEWQSSNEFTVSDDSKHQFYVKDVLGNESTKAFEASADNFDNVVPTISGVVPEDGWSNTSITFTVEATDNKSGIAGYRVDDGEWLSSAEFVIDDTDEHVFYVKDNAGNISEGYRTEKAKIETEVPVINSVVLSTDDWTNQPVTFTVNATDTQSGVVAYSKDNGVTWQSSNEFIISDDEVHYFVVKDGAGNVSAVTEMKADNYDKKAPVIDNIKAEIKGWTKKKIEVTVSATDDKSDRADILYRMDQGEWETTSNQFTIRDKKSHTFYVKDQAGNVSQKEFSYEYYDEKAPTLNQVYFSQKNDGVFAQWLNFLSFGLFFNEKLEITINAVDVADEISAASGIDKYIVRFYDASGVLVHERTQQNDNKFSINYAEVRNFKGTITVEIIDNAEVSTGEVQITAGEDGNSNLGDYTKVEFMVENDAPVISAISPADGSIHKKDFEISFSVSDEQVEKFFSGLAAVKVTVNGTVVRLDNYKDGAKPSEKYELQVNVADRKVNNVQFDDNAWNKGVLNVVFEAYDNAGNAAESQTTTVYIDRTSPIISGFQFSLSENIDVNSNNELYEAVDVDDYGFYFKEAVDVTIKAEDLVGENETKESGVSFITYKVVDVDDGEIMFEEHKLTEEEKKTNSITFTINKDFKGQIYAYATDAVGNYAGFVHPNGSVVETKEKHQKTSSIEIIASDKTATQNEVESYQYTKAQPDKEMAYDTTQPVPLYKENPTFDITVKDAYSGIRSVTWKVIENGKDSDQSGILNISNAGAVEDTSVGEWTIVKAQDSNLVYEAKTSITVDGAYNNMVLLVELTDRAGNVSYDYYMFGIDKRDPIVTVKMNDDDNESYDGFFKVDRTAKITILERNFINKNVEFEVTVTDENGNKKDIPITSNFVVEMDENNQPKATPYSNGLGEYYTYTMDYTFKDDGDYTFNIEVKDLVLRANEPVKYENANGDNIASISRAFTIDKKIPVVTVVYDNNSSVNGNYYKAARKATITIAEHNFEASDVKIIGTALDNNTKTTFPVPSEWKDNKNNTHTATISYTADAKYSFDIEYVDKAGHSIKDYVTEEFYVDNTQPLISISGVEDKTPYNGEVVPVIKITDTNYDKNKVIVSLNGVNSGAVNYEHSITDVENGQQYIYVNFEEIKDVDDIYTLTVEAIDLSGQANSQTVVFSVNRFGSVYDLSDIKDVNGKYLQKEKDIVFTETNVNTLDKETVKIKVTKNGTPRDLVEGKDYTVENTNPDGSWDKWSQYKYTIKKSVFAEDGKYSISIYSVDAATNVNENIDETKSAEIAFGIDKTKPVVVPVDFESNTQYAVDSKKVSVEIKDNLVLEGVKIYLNDKEIEYTVEGETYTFEIPKSNSKQTVRIVAVDAAGNEQPVLVEDFLVATNVFVRWYNNTPLFIGSIIVVVALGVGVTSFILFGKKKKEEE